MWECMCDDVCVCLAGCPVYMCTAQLPEGKRVTDWEKCVSYRRDARNVVRFCAKALTRKFWEVRVGESRALPRLSHSRMLVEEPFGLDEQSNCCIRPEPACERSGQRYEIPGAAVPQPIASVRIIKRVQVAIRRRRKRSNKMQSSLDRGG